MQTQQLPRSTLKFRLLFRYYPIFSSYCNWLDVSSEVTQYFQSLYRFLFKRFRFELNVDRMAMFGIFVTLFGVLAKSNAHIFDVAQTSYVQMFENFAQTVIVQIQDGRHASRWARIWWVHSRSTASYVSPEWSNFQCDCGQRSRVAGSEIL